MVYIKQTYGCMKSQNSQSKPSVIEREIDGERPIEDKELLYLPKMVKSTTINFYSVNSTRWLFPFDI